MGVIVIVIASGFELYPWQEKIIEVQKNMIQEQRKLHELFHCISESMFEIDARESYRSTWIVNLDTRLTSQVIDNKPRHLVKKIIH